MAQDFIGKETDRIMMSLNRQEAELREELQLIVDTKMLVQSIVQMSNQNNDLRLRAEKELNALKNELKKQSEKEKEKT